MIKHTLFAVSLLTLSSTISTMPTIPTTLNADALKERFQNMQAPQLDANTCANAAVVYVGFKAVEKLWGWMTQSRGATFEQRLARLDTATAENTTGLASLSAAVRGAEGKQDGIVQRVDKVEGRVTVLEGKAQGLQASIASIDARHDKEEKARSVGMSGNPAVTRSTGRNAITGKIDKFKQLEGDSNK